MNLLNPMRRRVLRAALLASLGCAVLAPVHAAGQADAMPDAMILSLSNKVLDLIRSDKAIRAGDYEGVQKLVDEHIMPHVDFDKMTRMAVGRAWRSASAEQRSALIAQFRTLLLRTYSGALSKVTDHKASLRPSHGQDPNATDVVVRTQVAPSQGEPIGLDYRLEKTDAGWKIYDLNILGVWLVDNYKNEFSSILNQDGIDGLIRTLTQKNQKLAASK